MSPTEGSEDTSGERNAFVAVDETEERRRTGGDRGLAASAMDTDDDALRRLCENSSRTAGPDVMASST